MEYSEPGAGSQELGVRIDKSMQSEYLMFLAPSS
jgi:hypothetical protein